MLFNLEHIHWYIPENNKLANRTKHTKQKQNTKILF